MTTADTIGAATESSPSAPPATPPASPRQALRALAERVRIAHGEQHPEILVVERLIGELDAELIPHMLKEEQVVHPLSAGAQ